MFKKILTLWFLICIFFSLFVSAVSAEPRIVKVWSTLEIGTNSMFITNIDVAFTELFFNTKTKFESLTLTVERKNSLPASYSFPDKTAYQYLKVDKSGIKDSDMSNTIIKFRVKKLWLSDNNINESSISLLRYSSGWKKQKTEMDFDDDVYHYYKSETDSFSYFAIVGEKKQIIPIVEEIIEEEAVPVVIEEEPEQKRNVSKIVILSLLSFIVIIAIAYINLKNKISLPIKNIGELKSYIQQAKSQGEQYTKIKTDLINEGWDEKEVDTYLSKTKIPASLKAKMIDYVKSALKKGKDKENIRNEFVDVGWQKEIIDDIFNSLA